MNCVCHWHADKAINARILIALIREFIIRPDERQKLWMRTCERERGKEKLQIMAKSWRRSSCEDCAEMEVSSAIKQRSIYCLTAAATGKAGIWI